MKSKLLNNKKGDISVTLLVVLTLILCGTSIFIFLYYDSKHHNDVSDFGAINSFYREQILVEDYMKNILLISIRGLDSQGLLTEKSLLDKFVKTYLDQYGTSAGNLRSFDIQQLRLSPPIIKLLSKDSHKYVSFNMTNVSFSNLYPEESLNALNQNKNLYFEEDISN